MLLWRWALLDHSKEALPLFVGVGVPGKAAESFANCFGFLRQFPHDSVHGRDNAVRDVGRGPMFGGRPRRRWVTTEHKVRRPQCVSPPGFQLRRKSEGSRSSSFPFDYGEYLIVFLIHQPLALGIINEALDLLF